MGRTKQGNVCAKFLKMKRGKHFVVFMAFPSFRAVNQEEKKNILFSRKTMKACLLVQESYWVN